MWISAFAALHLYWDELLAGFQVNTPNEHVNRMVNIWNAYQCMVTFNLSRSASLFESGIGRGLGYRDSNQDLLGIRPDGAVAGTRKDPGYCRDAIAGWRRLSPVPAIDQTRQ